MIFAAGLGTRLRPLTDNKPKALVELNGKPLLELAIRRLRQFGYTDIVVNVHHFAEQIIDFLAQHQHFGLNIQISDERGALLDTGGGLKKAMPLLGEGPVLLYNTDVLAELDLSAFRQAHEASGALASLAVRQRDSSRYLLFDQDLQLCGWRHARSGEERISRVVDQPQPLAFSGIHYIDTRLFDFMPSAAAFSIIKVYLAAARSERILGYRHDDSRWMDVGKLDALPAAEALAADLHKTQSPS